MYRGPEIGNCPEEPSVKKSIRLLKAILSVSEVDRAHGIEHALTVLGNVDKALAYRGQSVGDLSKDTITAIRLASLLHDADDRKFFRSDSGNAEFILKTVLPDKPEIRKLVLQMIDLVSCSKNGIATGDVEHEWMFYPRWADRLESLGHMGILRAYQYSIARGRPLDTPETPRTNSRELLYAVIATPQRFQEYLKKKESDTFIDHFYDKLLHLRKGFQTTNPYYLTELKKRHQVMEDFILEYCGTQNLESFIINHFPSGRS